MGGGSNPPQRVPYICRDEGGEYPFCRQNACSSKNKRSGYMCVYEVAGGLFETLFDPWCRGRC